MKGTATKISTSSFLDSRFSLREGTCLRSQTPCRTTFSKTHLLSKEQRLYPEDEVRAPSAIWLDGSSSPLRLGRRTLQGTENRLCCEPGRVGHWKLGFGSWVKTRQVWYGLKLIKKKRQRRERDCSKPREHIQKNPKSRNYNHGEELSFCCFFWTGLN